MFALFFTLSVLSLTRANQRHSYGANCECSTRQLTEVYSNARGTPLAAITPRMCTKKGSRTEVRFRDITFFGHRYNVSLSNLGSHTDCTLQWLDGTKWSTCNANQFNCYIVINSSVASDAADVKVRARCNKGATLCPVLLQSKQRLSSLPKGLLPADVFPHSTRDFRQRLKENPSCRLFELKVEGKVYHKRLKANQDFILVCAGECKGNGCKCKSLNPRVLDRVSFKMDRQHNPQIVYEYAMSSDCEEDTSRTGKGKSTKGESIKGTSRKGKGEIVD